MNKKQYFLNISKGTVRAILLTIIVMLVYSIIMNFTDLSLKTSSVVYLVTTCLSIVYGAIYASKANNKKGWFTGLITALLYMVIIFIVAMITNGPAVILTLEAFLRLILALAVGALSGMLGINI